MATVAEELADQEAWLVLLKEARNDIASSGLAKRVEKGNVVITYENLKDVNLAIRETNNRIVILDREIY